MSAAGNPLPLYAGKRSKTYVASGEVAEIVRLAIDLKRPLLVEGEPGCGKTRLAYAIAEELGLGEPIKISVKSTSRAQDLLYRINALKRLQDAQNPQNTDAQFVYKYLALGELGEAIQRKSRCVVLIDEVDKADIDFPNDLLDVLENLEFEIPDLPKDEEKLCLAEKKFGRTVKGDEDAPPIVVITSNREKRLPEPFLRRCLYLRLKFPADPAELTEIVRKNTLHIKDWNEELLSAAIQAFQQVRGTAETLKLQKLPATSELIDWAKILYLTKANPTKLKDNSAQPPYWQTLFKTMPDLDKYEAASVASKQTAKEKK